ncbi:hypothetical protein HZA26_01355 [Candidatus Nomurabacteria bacterium]|nr:hypothetical protein [Candidatus Nomurabacteria bacterium]
MNYNIKKILKITALSVFFIFIIIYAFYRSSSLIFGVEIKNVNISDGAKFTSASLEITGVAKGAIKLTLNDREISIDGAGNFRDEVVLLSGYNVISIRAIDKFGYVDEKNYKLIRE